MATPEFDQTIKPILLTLRWCGLWPSDGHSRAYRMYGISMLVVFSFLLTLTMLIQLFGFNDFDSLTDSMYMALTEFALFIKIVNFYLRNDSMHKHVQTAKNFQLETYAEVKLFNTRMRLIHRIIVMLFISVNIAHFSSEMKTFFTPGLLLLFPASYPAGWLDGGAKYLLAYGHQSIGAFITSNLEAYTCLMLYMVAVQMEILGMRLRSFGHDIVDSSNRGQSDAKRRNNGRKRFNQLRKFIQLHQRILMLGISSMSIQMKHSQIIFIGISGMPRIFRSISPNRSSARSLSAQWSFVALPVKLPK